MKMQLLGTGAGDFPRVDDLQDNSAYLPRVRKLGGRNLRRPAQAMLFPDILIDYHDGRQLETFGIAPESIRHLLLTHRHWDHFRPLRILEFAAALPHQLQVHGSHGVIEALRFADTYDLDRGNGRFKVRETHADIGYHVIEPKQTYDIADTSVSVVHANHHIDKSDNMIMEDLSLNFVFERDGRTIFYGLDSAYPLPLTVEYLRRFRLDAAILDGTFGQLPIDAVKSGHHNLEMLMETIEELRTAGIFHEGTSLLASHIALVPVKPHDDLKDEVSEMGITLAYDGLTLEV